MNMNIGERIKQRRIQLNLSQDELAKKLGYKSRSSINKIELNGRDLPADKIYAIALALDTTPAYIMGWVNDADSELLSKYHSLTSDQRQTVKALIDTLVAQNGTDCQKDEQNFA